MQCVFVWEMCVSSYLSICLHVSAEQSLQLHLPDSGAASIIVCSVLFLRICVCVFTYKAELATGQTKSPQKVPDLL